MKTFILFINKPNHKVWDRLQRQWPSRNVHIYSNNIAFIADDDTHSTEDIGKKAGIGPDMGGNGLVVECRNYFGFMSIALAAWMDNVKNR